MEKTKCGVVYLIFTALCIHLSAASFEDDMWDRFRVWFHTMDHNADGVLSIEDIEPCTPRYMPTSDNPATVRAKCEEFLSRWSQFFVLRGQKAITENQFIQTFSDLREEGVKKFENLIYWAAKLFWIIMDMNNDGWITQDEDACVGERIYDASLLSISFAHYLLLGRPEADIDDIFCPWIYL